MSWFKKTREQSYSMDINELDAYMVERQTQTIHSLRNKICMLEERENQLVDEVKQLETQCAALKKAAEQAGVVVLGCDWAER